MASDNDIDWNPGGTMAKLRGCTCPRLENRFGVGALINDVELPEFSKIHFDPTGYESSFVIKLHCPLHDDTPHPGFADLGREGNPFTG